MEHLSVCSKKRGFNVASVHAGVKQQINKLCQFGEMQTTSVEEVYRRMRCGCGREFSALEFSHHKRHAGCGRSDDASTRNVQADGKILTTTRAIVYDNTSPNPMAPSYRGDTPEALMRSVRAAKVRRYSEAAKRLGDDFEALCLPIHGFSDAGTMAVLKRLFGNGPNGVTMQVVMTELRRAVELGSGQVLALAERSMEVIGPIGYRHDPYGGSRIPVPVARVPIPPVRPQRMPEARLSDTLPVGEGPNAPAASLCHSLAAAALEMMGEAPDTTPDVAPSRQD